LSNIGIKTVGRSLLFPTVLFCWVVRLQSADLWSELFSDLFGFPEVTVIRFCDFQQTTPVFDLTATCDDLFTKKITRRDVLGINGYQTRFALNYPKRFRERQHLARLELADDAYRFTNRRDLTMLSAQVPVHLNEYRLQWATTTGKGLFGIGGTGWRAATVFDLRIKRFPTSPDLAMNLFFLDHLPGTFGDELHHHLDLNRQMLLLWGSTPIVDHGRFGLAVTLARLTQAWAIRYTNQNNYAALNGRRRLDVPADGTTQLVKLWWENPGDRAQISLTFYRNRYALETANHPPGMIDYASLGFLDWSRIGVRLDGYWRRERWRLQGGLSCAKYDLDFEVNTPVLGLMGGILPIAHSMEGDFKRGGSFGQQAAAQTTFRWLNCEHTPSLQFSHTTYRLWIRGEAHLEFGLYSRPLDYPFDYELYLLNCDWHAERRFGRWTIAYTFRQLLPYGRRLDASPLQFFERRPDLRYQYRGGQSHQLALSYKL